MRTDTIKLRPDLERAVTSLGWSQLTPIQERLIPVLRAGRDVVAQAQTGTGKTAAFGIPLLERVAGMEERPAALVIVPTRELCVQVAGDLARLAMYSGTRVAAVYGGDGYGGQERILRDGIHVVVGTPGRLLDLVERRTLDLRGARVLVLDEADRLLDESFVADVRRIVALLPKERQTALLSATFTPAVRDAVTSLTKDAVSVSLSSRGPTVESIEQGYVEVRHVDKLRALRAVLAREEARRVLVFRRTKRGVDKLARDLARIGHNAAALHSDIPQRTRIRALERFRTGAVRTLVATNLAARGIHVEGIDHVVNFDLPEDPETYVHRIGRTGRAGATGRALTFVTETQHQEFHELGRKARVTFRREQMTLPA